MPGYEITEELAGLLVFGVATGVSWALTSLRRATHQITDLKEELETTRRIIEASSSSFPSPNDKQIPLFFNQLSNEVSPVIKTSALPSTSQSTTENNEASLLTSISPPVNVRHTNNSSDYGSNQSGADTDEHAVKPFSPSVLFAPPHSPPHHSQIDISEDFDDSTVFSSPMPTTTLFHNNSNKNLLSTPPRNLNQEEDPNLSRFYTFSTPQSAPPVTPNLTPITVHHQSHPNHDFVNLHTSNVTHPHNPIAVQPSTAQKRSGTPTSVKSNGSNSTTPVRRLRSETPISKHRSTMVLKGHTSMIQSIAVCTDEKYVISASLDRTIKIWQLSTGHCVKTLRGHTGGVYCVATLAHKSTSDSSSSPATSPSQAAPTAQNSTPSSSIMTEKILSGGDDNTIKLWEPTSGRCLQTWRGHSDTVSCMLVLSQQPSLSSSSDGNVDILDNYVNRKYHSEKLNNSSGNANVCWVVSGSWDKTLRVWDATHISGTSTAGCLGVLSGHTRQIQCLSLVSVISKNGSDSNNVNKKMKGWRIVSGSWDRSLRVWDMCFQTNSSNGNSATLSYDCVAVLSGHSDYVLCVTALTVPHSFFHSNVQTNDNTATTEANTNDVSVLVSGSIDRTIRFWRLDLLPENDHSNHHTHTIETATSNTNKTSSNNRHTTPTATKQTKAAVPARSTPTRRGSTTSSVNGATNVHLHSYASSGQSVTGQHLNHVCFYIYREPNAAIYCVSPYVVHNGNANSQSNLVHFVSGSFYRTLTLWSLSHGDQHVATQDTQQQDTQYPHHGRVIPQRWKSPSVLPVSRQSTLLSPVRSQPPTRTPTSVNHKDGHHDTVTITANALHHHNLQHQTSSVHNHGTNISTNTNHVPHNMNLINLEAVRLCEGHKGTASCVVVLSDGRVISGSRDETLLVWSPLC